MTFLAAVSKLRDKLRAAKTPRKTEAIRNSGLLDADWYRAEYLDVALLGMDPALHYLKYGAAMGRDPGPNFSSSFYSDLHPDVQRKGRNPLLHHLGALRRTGRPAEPARRNVFWAASRLGLDKVDQAVALAETLVPEENAHALEILRANAALGDDSAWLDHLNRYLAHFEMAPVELASEGPTRFHRLTSGPLPPVGTGPLVSIIMPAWNAEATLEHAARSILGQTWQPIELIIVDDASTDDTWSVMQALAAQDRRVRLLRNSRNVGPYVSKNIALTQVQGDFVTGHDADDWAHPQRIERHVRFSLGAGRRLRASDAYMLRMDAGGAFGKFASKREETPDGAARTAMISCLFETAFLRERLGYWQNVRFGGDTEMIGRAKIALGEEYTHAPLLGMLCLDSETSLTNHPDHGMGAGGGGMSPTRRTFKKNWTDWHEILDRTSVYLPFGHRPFPIPQEMLNAPEDVEAVVEGHANSGTPVDFRTTLECDLCIATDLRFAGGNASSTLDEVRFFTGHGLKVVLLDLRANQRSGKPLSDRYAPYYDLVRSPEAVGHVRCTSLLVRSPSVACSAAFSDMKRRIRAEHVYIVVNNSATRPSGEPVYSPDELFSVAGSFEGADVRICPISSLIRSELVEGRDPDQASAYLSRSDWNPTFDLHQYMMAPKPRLAEPTRLGRHSRDGAEKWIESAEALLGAYPPDPDYRIRILGGAKKAKQILGKLPANWDVEPFGAVSPKEFLRDLDVFVYFPHTKLTEAFGRAIAEAMIGGVPCVLPASFRATFGNLAFYCAPHEVRGVVARLKEDDARRVALLSEIQRHAAASFGSAALAQRLPELGIDAGLPAAPGQTEVRHELEAFRAYVESGR